MRCVLYAHFSLHPQNPFFVISASFAEFSFFFFISGKIHTLNRVNKDICLHLEMRMISPASVDLIRLTFDFLQDIVQNTLNDVVNWVWCYDLYRLQFQSFSIITIFYRLECIFWWNILFSNEFKDKCEPFFINFKIDLIFIKFENDLIVGRYFTTS